MKREVVQSNQSKALCANISETFPAVLIREQGGKEMNHERISKRHGGFTGKDGS